MKKYLIRIIGALCILAAAATMFLPAWVQLEDISRKDLRETRDDITGILDEAHAAYDDVVLNEDDVKDEAKECDLPTTKRQSKKFFGDLEDLVKDLLDESISFKEIFLLAWKAPGIMNDLKNLADADFARDVLMQAAFYHYDYGVEYDYEVGRDFARSDADSILTFIEDTFAEAEILNFVFYGVSGIFVLLFALALLSAITHICNKGRWVKYLFLVLAVAMVAGSCYAFPLASDVFSEMLQDAPALEDMSLAITATPFVAIALLIVPVVLDIVFERKKKVIQPQEIQTEV